MKPETLALHAGFNGDPTTNAATTPIYQTTSYTFDDTQHGADLFNLAVPGNIYSRIMNPTNAVLEQRLADIDAEKSVPKPWVPPPPPMPFSNAAWPKRS